MKFTVIGRVSFPIDMLRYDGCYPATEADSAHITRTLEARNIGEVSIHLQMDHRTRRPTEGRWESFMWKVTDVRREEASR